MKESLKFVVQLIALGLGLLLLMQIVGSCGGAPEENNGKWDEGYEAGLKAGYEDGYYEGRDYGYREGYNDCCREYNIDDGFNLH